MPEEKFDPRRHALESMTEDEKDELLVQLFERNSVYVQTAVELHNSLQYFSAQLEEFDVLGFRGKGMRSVAHRMLLVAAVSRNNMGVDESQTEADYAFEDIVSRLDMDDD